MKLPTSKEMQELDRCAIEDFGIPGIILMENAGLATVLMMEREIGPPAGHIALIFIGPGNNGGDGLVIGRHLYQRGCTPHFFFLVNPDNLKGDAKTNLEIIKKLRIPFHIIDSYDRVKTVAVLTQQILSRGRPCYSIVDAIFGTGLSRPIEGHIADTISLINKPDFVRDIPVVAVDIPSGVDSNNGQILGTCIKANFTATYGCPQPGHLLFSQQDLVSGLHVLDIGIPNAALFNASIQSEWITPDSISLSLKVISRETSSHKGKQGHILMLAGAAGKTGAALLAARGCLKSGCGLISLLVPENLNSIFETALFETMSIPLPASKNFPSIDDLALIEEHLPNKQAMVIGPGIGTDSKTSQLIIELFNSVEIPIVFDADALNILAENIAHLKKPPGHRILTPHPGEMARMLDCPVQEVQENRIQTAQSLAALFPGNSHDFITVLKGSGTIVCSNNGELHINTTGNPGMATGGMGDVLAGIIGALIGQGMPPFLAARTGVFLHGAAGDMLHDLYGPGYTATELADTLPACRKKFTR